MQEHAAFRSTPPAAREPVFKLFPRKVNPGQTKLLVILDAAPTSGSIEEVEVVFNYGSRRRLVVEEFKLVKNDVIQIGRSPKMIAHYYVLIFLADIPPLPKLKVATKYIGYANAICIIYWALPV